MNLAAQIAQRRSPSRPTPTPRGTSTARSTPTRSPRRSNAGNFPIDADNVKIEGPLKELGLYTIKLHLGQDVETEVKLWVVPTHTEEAAT